VKNHLELVSLEKLYPKKERVSLPRYPIPQLTFKRNASTVDHHHNHHSLEVRDISSTGMQLENKLNALDWNIGDLIEGNLKLGLEKISMSCEVVWVRQSRAGLRFKNTKVQQEVQDKVLNISKLIESIKPLHLSLMQEKPLDLRYWFQASGPLEFMVWGNHADPLASCIWIYSHFFVQWNDTEGLKTGKIYRQREEDEWNLMEGECVLLFDHELNDELLEKLALFINSLNESLFQEDDYSILRTKLRCY
jgi:hypothetical protein